MDARWRSRSLPRMSEGEGAKLRKRQITFLEQALAWLQEQLHREGSAKKATLTELARRANVDPATLTRFVNKPDHSSNLSATTLAKIEGLTGVRAGSTNNIVHLHPPVAFLSVVGVASAGTFRDMALTENRTLGETAPVGPVSKWAGYPQYALRIEGPSVNRRAPSGSYAICVEWASIGMEWPRSGQFVHIERWRAGEAEVTIKQFRLEKGRPMLFPFSTDPQPQHQEPIDPRHPDEDTEVRIRGLVIGWHILED